MREIQGEARTVNQLLRGVKYSVDYYQREYKWKSKQVMELVKDLTSQFLEDYQPEHERRRVEEYSHYFLGSIIISNKDGTSYIVDGQQRLTSLTLLLIYLRNLQQELDLPDKVNIDDLIFSERYGEKSFNLQIEERTSCMRELFRGDAIDDNNGSESVRNLVARYSDIEQEFPDELRGPALPYFMDWLVENVHLVKITAYSDEDAYTIFETMNDRGLSLTATEMLKGYLLTNITDPEKRDAANEVWKSRIAELNAMGKDVEADSFKAWFRSQYSTKIRVRKKGAKPEDFDRMGTEFHRWVRDSSEAIGLIEGNDFFRFIQSDFEFYSRQYMRIVRASETVTPGLEHIRYNADHGFTLQNMLLLAPLCPGDDDASVFEACSRRPVRGYPDNLAHLELPQHRIFNHAILDVPCDARDPGFGTMRLGTEITQHTTRRIGHVHQQQPPSCSSAEPVLPASNACPHYRLRRNAVGK